MKYILNSDLPAKEWRDGYPIGNGRIAAMIWGDEILRISLNNEWLWTGQNGKRRPEKRSQFLGLVRQVIREGDPFRSAALTNAVWGGKGGISEVKNQIDSFAPAGDICLKLKGQKEFISRSLDMKQGVVNEERKTEEDIHFEGFAAAKDDVLAFRAESKTPFSAELYYEREPDDKLEYLHLNYDADGYIAEGKYKGGFLFQVFVRVLTDGKSAAAQNKLSVENATYIIISSDILTTQDKKTSPSLLCALPEYESVKKRHVALFSEEIGGVVFRIDGNDAEITKKDDLRLAETYFDLGRYLFLSGTLRGELPLNLQGKWNRSVTPPWASDYHININLQMNYWAAEKVGFSRAVVPLKNYILKCARQGRSLAKNFYGARGFVFTHSCDEWAIPYPQGCGWDVWIGGAGWLGQHLMRHFEYTGDIKFLKECYPYFKGLAEFYEDYLVKDDRGIYQIIPSQSPENRYEGTGCFPVSIGVSSAMDIQIAHDSFEMAIRASEILRRDAASRQKWIQMKNSLPKLKIGKDGRLCEWAEEQVETEKGHRHFSHLYGLYPGDLFTKYRNKKYFSAAKSSLDFRMQNGGGGTGWSAAWAAAMYARCGDKPGFSSALRKLMQCSTESLLDLIPPDIFQIDGNLGGVAAIVESIISEQGGYIVVGGALPSEWGSGSLNGITLRGGHKADVYWDDGIVKKIVFTANKDDIIGMIVNGRKISCKLEKGRQTIV